MKNKVLLVVLVIAVLTLAAFIMTRQNQTQTRVGTPALGNKPTDARQPRSSSATKLVPAYYETAPSLNSLASTLPPEQFSGKAREAYQAVKMIPQTIAQMPCYCHCDRSIGHKSLHSCFEDGHATSCATCIDEALLVYKLQKSGLTAQQIRERIIAEFS
ncbi:MAG: CYCXC family (seleno)protein [Pyrinomonadaceae bacterium]